MSAGIRADEDVLRTYFQTLEVKQKSKTIDLSLFECWGTVKPY